MSNSFKDSYSFDERLKESTKILTKYPDKIPIIVTKYRKCKNLEDIEKNKFLVPADLTIAQFTYIIKKRLNISAEMSIYVFVNGESLPTSSDTVGSTYDNNKDDDKFLYLEYAGENTFGN